MPDNQPIFKSDFHVLPCCDGGFVLDIVHFGRNQSSSERWAFTDIDDLMTFLTKHAAAFKAPEKAAVPAGTSSASGGPSFRF